MGVDKALLDVDGATLLARPANALARVCESVSLVGDPGKYAHCGLPVVADNFPALGPLAGIEAALAATAFAWNLVVACDMPSLDPLMMESLFNAAEGFDAAVPQHPDGFVEPLCAVYHRRCHAVVLNALESGVRRVTDILQSLAVRYVQTGGDSAFANLNTPDDVRKYTNG